MNMKINQLNNGCSGAKYTRSVNIGSNTGTDELGMECHCVFGNVACISVLGTEL